MLCILVFYEYLQTRPLERVSSLKLSVELSEDPHKCLNLIFVKSGIAFNTFERERKYETCLMSLLYERCFQLYEGYKLHEFMSALSTVCNLKQRTTAGTQIRSALSRKAHHEQTVY